MKKTIIISLLAGLALSAGAQNMWDAYNYSQTNYLGTARSVGMGNAINYFSSYNNPLGIVMSTKGQYFLYLAIRFVLACCITTLVYLPLALKDKRNKKVGAQK